MRRPVTFAVTLVLACGVALSTAGCGGSGKNSDGCGSIKNELQSISSNTATMVSDPSAMAKQYRTSAASIRADGKKGDGDLSDAADAYASGLESMASAISSGSGDSVSAVNQMNTGAKKLVDACGWKGGDTPKLPKM